jgi:hypothetical protein
VLAIVLVVVTFPTLAATVRGDAAVPHFVEEAAAAGIDHVYDGDFDFFVGGGVAVFDCNEDGRPDLYFAAARTRQPRDEAAGRAEPAD